MLLWSGELSMVALMSGMNTGPAAYVSVGDWLWGLPTHTTRAGMHPSLVCTDSVSAEVFDTAGSPHNDERSAMDFQHGTVSLQPLAVSVT